MESKILKNLFSWKEDIEARQSKARQSYNSLFNEKNEIKPESVILKDSQKELDVIKNVLGFKLFLESMMEDKYSLKAWENDENVKVFFLEFVPIDEANYNLNSTQLKDKFIKNTKEKNEYMFKKIKHITVEDKMSNFKPLGSIFRSSFYADKSHLT